MSRLLLYSDRNGIYGAERIHQELAVALQAAGWDVVVAQPPGENELTRALDRAGIARHALPVENVYDAQSPAASLTDPGIGEACFEATTPDVVLFGDGFLFASLAAKAAAARRGIPFVSLVHVLHPAWKREFAPFLPELARSFAAARQVVTVSQANLGLLREHFGLADGHGTVIHNGRPAEFFRPRDASARRRIRRSLGIGDDAVVAATIGRFDHEKGWDLLLDAMPRLRRDPAWANLAFLWVGDGPLRARAARLAKLLADDRVHLLGERSDLADLLDAADFLVHPSRTEGLPLVVLEAMARGLAVVATPVGGIPEAIADGGRILPAADEPGFRDCLADAILALAKDEGLRRTLGRRAHDRASRCFTMEHMTAKWLALVSAISSPTR